jgi:hypothetical protein
MRNLVAESELEVKHAMKVLLALSSESGALAFIACSRLCESEGSTPDTPTIPEAGIRGEHHADLRWRL